MIEALPQKREKFEYCSSTDFSYTVIIRALRPEGSVVIIDLQLETLGVYSVPLTAILTTVQFIRVIRAVFCPITSPLCINALPVSTLELRASTTSCRKQCVGAQLQIFGNSCIFLKYQMFILLI